MEVKRDLGEDRRRDGGEKGGERETTTTTMTMGRRKKRGWLQSRPTVGANRDNGHA
jgi:hypothetical protein